MKLSPLIHQLSTSHPEAIVEMRLLSFSAKWQSPLAMPPIFWQAYSTVV